MIGVKVRASIPILMTQGTGAKLREQIFLIENISPFPPHFLFFF